MTNIPLSPSDGDDCVLPLPDPGIPPICGDTAGAPDLGAIGDLGAAPADAGRALLDAAASASTDPPAELAALVHTPWYSTVTPASAVALVTITVLVLCLAALIGYGVQRVWSTR